MEIYCKIRNVEGRYFPPIGGLVLSTNDQGNCNSYFNTMACLL